METPILSGQKRSKFYFNKIDIFADRMEAKGALVPKKTIYLKDIDSWIEINRLQNPGNISWTEFTLFAGKKNYKIMSLHWNNYNEMRDLLTKGKHRDTEKERKIYKK